MFPPIRIKTKPTIFIMKRRTNIKYDPDKARVTKDVLQPIDNAGEEIELSTLRETTVETKPIFDDIVESLEEFGKPEEIDEQDVEPEEIDEQDVESKEIDEQDVELEEINEQDVEPEEIDEQDVSDIEPEKIDEQDVSDVELEHIMETSDNIEEEINRRDNFVDDNTDDSMVPVENVQTTNVNKLSPNFKSRKREEDFELREDFESMSSIYDAKFDEEVKPKIEESKVIKGRLKNNLNLGQEGHSVKETVKKMIQEKMQEVKQKREIKNGRKNVELPLKLIKREKKESVATELPRRIKILKQELKETTVLTDKPAMVKERVRVTKRVVRDEDVASKLIKAKNITQKINKIKAMKPDLKQIVDEEGTTVEQENETADMTVEKITKAEDSVDTESPIIPEKIVQEDDRENIKAPKPLNIRESIRNIINQFKDFERDFVYDDVDSKASAYDTSDINRIESDVTEKDSSAVNYSAGGEDQLAAKDPRESLKEIIDQFKYIKHELTSEEDDQFDDIAAKYMERPIGETLLQFSEALKSLMQRRRKTSLPEQASSSNNNKDDQRTSEDSSQTKRAKKTTAAGNDRNKEKVEALRAKPKIRQENVIVNKPKHNLNEISDANKDTNMPASTEEVSISAQQHNDKILSNVGKIDVAKKGSSQKNAGNSRSE